MKSDVTNAFDVKQRLKLNQALLLAARGKRAQ
jgi:hypothetical protein